MPMSRSLLATWLLFISWIAVVQANSSSKQCTCTSSGDPHYLTFDGKRIHFQGECKYTLAKSSHPGASCYFEVEAKNEHRKGNRKVTWTRLVDVRFRGNTVRIGPGTKVTVNGIHRTLPVVNVPGLIVEWTNNRVTARATGCGFSVTFDGTTASVSISRSTHGGKVHGICGNCNGKGSDDLVTREGVDVSSSPNKDVLIGDSYSVPDDSDKPVEWCRSKTVLSSCNKKHIYQFSHNGFCGRINNRKGPFRACINSGTVDYRSYFKFCMFDLCAMKGSNDVRRAACRAVEAFAEACAKAGYAADWRTSKFCPMKCGRNQVYKARATGCPNTCLCPKCEYMRRKCPNPTREACVCTKGHILSGTKCVKRHQCGCQTTKGNYFPLGAKWYCKDCSHWVHCTLKKGKPTIVNHKIRCHRNAVCGIKDGKRACVCREGYKGNGLQCEKACPRFMCRRLCKYGFKIECGCRVCKCKRCPEFKCYKKCKFGYVRDSRGCRKCRCNKYCPRPQCWKKCPFGRIWKRNKFGCWYCICRRPVCKKPKCPHNCKYGVRHTKNRYGCKICVCRFCKEIKCPKKCKHGYIVRADKRGCLKLCKCRTCKPSPCPKKCAFGYRTIYKGGCRLACWCKHCHPAKCPKKCAHGFLKKYKRGCLVKCSCKKCKNVHCPHKCDFGYIKKYKGKCLIKCVCKPCKPVSCPKYCPFGYRQKFKKECRIHCSCKRCSPAPCPSDCPFGLKKKYKLKCRTSCKCRPCSEVLVKCPKHCPHGYKKKYRHKCRISCRCKSCHPARCPKKECHFGYKKKYHHGCRKSCKCKPCSSALCPDHCPHGYRKKFVHSCRVSCRCKECQHKRCPKHCHFGYIKKHKHNCRKVCRCRPCSAVRARCAGFCPFGYIKKYKHGCLIKCDCKPCKAASCPKFCPWGYRKRYKRGCRVSCSCKGCKAKKCPDYCPFGTIKKYKHKCRIGCYCRPCSAIRKSCPKDCKFGVIRKKKKVPTATLR